MPLFTDDHMDQAVERLIIARATHLDSLAARLHEPRVKRIVEPLIAGAEIEVDATCSDDLAYLRDLGLIGRRRRSGKRFSISACALADPEFPLVKPLSGAASKRKPTNAMAITPTIQVTRTRRRRR